MAGSDSFAPVVMSGSGEMPPSMVTETSSGMSERFTLDHSSFEKLLAAAWVLQCLHDQLHDQDVGRDKAIADRVKTPERLNAGSPTLSAVVEKVAQAVPEVASAETMFEMLSSRTADDRVLVEPVVQQPAESNTLCFDVPVKVEPRPVEAGTSVQSQSVAALDAGGPLLSVLGEPAGDDQKKAARSRPAFDLCAAKLRTAFSSALDTFIKLRPAFRVNLTQPALRAAAIATPVLLLTLVAASLLLGTWHRQPANSAQAISGPSAPTAAAAVNDISATQTTTKRAASDDHKRITNRRPNRSGDAIPPPRSSHRQVTDPATLSAVRRLSKYELGGLRRQAKYGDASAAFALGMAYEVGQHVPQNCAEAARWVRTAADAGNAAADYNLGLRYRDGDGVPANRAESAKWLRRAAARRYPKANLALKMLASR
jgi:hypothetical protein